MCLRLVYPTYPMCRMLPGPVLPGMHSEYRLFFTRIAHGGHPRPLVVITGWGLRFGHVTVPDDFEKPRLPWRDDVTAMGMTAATHRSTYPLTYVRTWQRTCVEYGHTGTLRVCYVTTR